jgi:aspartyl-tRNA(Asn)/glutamyl-tRNA(Gln) amidotransferase subunit A
VRDPSTFRMTDVEQRAARSTQARLRVGVPQNYFFAALHGEVGRALDAAIETLRKAGADIRQIAFPITDETMAQVFDPIVVTEIHERFARDWRDRPEAFSPSFAAFFKAPVPSALEVAAAHRALRAFQSDVRRLFQDIDVIVTPTVAVTAPPIDGPIDGALILRNTWPFNAARTPAMSVPCGVDSAGMPIGLQLIAAPYAEDTLFRAGLLYQRLTTWHLRRPNDL